MVVIYKTIIFVHELKTIINYLNREGDPKKALQRIGYTHYNRFTPTEKTPEQFKIVLDECKKIIEAHPGLAFGWDNEKGGFYGEPFLTPDEIELNGHEDDDLCNETFIFRPDKGHEFAFCKTARKPYDLVVCLILISLFKNLDGFSFSSDGDMTDEWQPIVDEYQRLFDGSLSDEKIQEMTREL